MTERSAARQREADDLRNRLVGLGYDVSRRATLNQLRDMARAAEAGRRHCGRDRSFWEVLRDRCLDCDGHRATVGRLAP